MTSSAFGFTGPRPLRCRSSSSSPRGGRRRVGPQRAGGRLEKKPRYLAGQPVSSEPRRAAALLSEGHEQQPRPVSVEQRTDALPPSRHADLYSRSLLPLHPLLVADPSSSPSPSTSTRTPLPPPSTRLPSSPPYYLAQGAQPTPRQGLVSGETGPDLVATSVSLAGRPGGRASACKGSSAHVPLERQGCLVGVIQARDTLARRAQCSLVPV